MNNIEILENKIQCFRHLQNTLDDDEKELFEDGIQQKEIEAIENLIQENKELKKQMGKDLDVVYIKGVYDERDKWKSKVKDKIEKLNYGERIKFYTEDKKHYYETNSFNEAIKYVLQELLEGE